MAQTTVSTTQTMPQSRTAHERSAAVARMMLDEILPRTLSRPSLPDSIRQKMLVDLEPVAEAMLRQNYKFVIDTANRVNAFGRIAIAEGQLCTLPLPDNIRVELQGVLAELQGRLEENKPNAYHAIAQEATNLSTRIVNESDKAAKERVLERALELYDDIEVMSAGDQIFMLSALSSLGQAISQVKHTDVDWTKVHDRMSSDYIERNLPGLAIRVLDAKSVVALFKGMGRDLTRDLGHVRQATGTQRPPKRVRKAASAVQARQHLAAISA